MLEYKDSLPLLGNVMILSLLGNVMILSLLGNVMILSLLGNVIILTLHGNVMRYFGNANCTRNPPVLIRHPRIRTEQHFS